MTMYSTDQIYQWLEEVKDPEIPVLSLVDLGVITHVSVTGSQAQITMTPTFVGCPALDMMKEEVIEALRKHGLDAQVTVSFRESWTSDRITEKGRAALRKFGLAPPPARQVLIEDIDMLEHVPCPRCQGTNTELRNPFGPTLCRSIHYCLDCREAFEQFKPL